MRALLRLLQQGHGRRYIPVCSHLHRVSPIPARRALSECASPRFSSLPHFRFFSSSSDGNDEDKAPTALPAADISAAASSGSGDIIEASSSSAVVEDVTNAGAAPR